MTCDSVQERFDQAVYCDARVMEIQRKLHDASTCTCAFIVRYDHDFSQVSAEQSPIGHYVKGSVVDVRLSGHLATASPKNLVMSCIVSACI